MEHTKLDFSTRSACLRIVSCASDPAADQNENEDEPAPIATERKRSTEKRRWSFRKRSARHKDSSNTLSSDTPSSGHKGGSETEDVVQAVQNCNALEKITLLQHVDEKPSLRYINTYTNNLVEKDAKVAFAVDESIVVVTQAAIRSFLAQKELSKLKSIVKLQGAVRGYLVRRQAVGALLCLKAIIKIQNLVRARQNLAHFERSCVADDTKNHEKAQVNGVITGPEVAYTFFQVLLTNGFANKLLGSLSKNRHFNFKCDLSNPNATWDWMERWTSVASPNLVELREHNFRMHQVERGTVIGSPRQGENDTDSDVKETRHDTQSVAMKMPEPGSSEENCISSNHESQTSPLQEILVNCSSLENCQRSPEVVESNSMNADDKTQIFMESLGGQPLPLDSNFHPEVNTVSSQPEVEAEQQREDPIEIAASESSKTVKQYVTGPRKASNPAFIAAQMKFKELSLSSYSAATDSSNGISPTGADTLNMKKCGLSDHNPPGQGVGLECYMEHSTPLTPENDDNGTECFDDPVVPDEGVEIKNQNLRSVPAEPENSSGVNVTSLGSTEHLEHGEKLPEITDSDLQTKLETENNHELDTFSSECSPESQVLIPDSQAKPSVQQHSANRNKRKTSKGSSQKNSPSSGKTSPLNLNVPRKSFEKPSKDEKPQKKRNSFSPTTPDRVDPQHKEVHVPSYMQPTESAKAKASPSPKSSPKSLPSKKRQSEVNVGHVYPKLHVSPSQVQRPAKSNGRSSPQDKKGKK